MNKNNFIRILLTISQIPGIGRKTTEQFAYFVLDNNFCIDICSVDICLDIINKYSKLNTKLSFVDIHIVITAYALANTIIEQSEKNSIEILSFIHDTYPKQFLKLKDKPVLLHCKGGNIDVLQKNSISIIGCRKASDHALVVGSRMTKSFIKKSYVIVSGLALGCDSVAHKACVDNNHPSIAVMAGGLHAVYPKLNTYLAEGILNTSGMLISEYPWGQSPSKYSFVQRDRLQACLSDATVVLETSLKGGSMHTIDFALKQNKKIACLFSHVDANLGEIDNFKGNKFLVEHKGAFALRSEGDLEDFVKDISLLEYKSIHQMNIPFV